MKNVNEEVGIPLTHVELVRDKMLPFNRNLSTQNLADILHDLLDTSPVEQFVTIYLRNGQLVGAERTAIGQASMVGVAMPEIFRGAIMAGATEIVIGHNHINGNMTPSDPDIDMTDIAVRAGILMQIGVYDHIIVSPNGLHFSFFENVSILETRVRELHLKNMIKLLDWDMRNMHKLPGMRDLNKEEDFPSFKKELYFDGNSYHPDQKKLDPMKNYDALYPYNKSRAR